MPGKLYLIPNIIGEGESSYASLQHTAEILGSLRIFFVEEGKTARRLLKKIVPNFPLAECEFYNLNEHTPAKEIPPYLEMVLQKDAGIISESGCPCVADPGADIVLLAHQRNIEVVPLIGPSSILLAVMASGLNGQNFAFNGYLPKEKNARLRKIKSLEARSFEDNQTQVFMEAPYRNQNLFEDVLLYGDDKTWLCLACDLTGPNQAIKTKTIKEWKKEKPLINKTLCLFLLKKGA